ncbi:hypothetical protein TTHERM_00794560 (macronuclear) [Tetrahymena thermophila SB210]|uniref:Uncharacterized protein n=1 Tax=Tetrahymena thermophila (strain SB210) TaxID=312017 RepID=Q23VX5_TETTS|nr:hypothetical protein TTHERM_00794560 [Tetrahymena thermophila SB210]EAS00730.2 hypothetical protein TTHERM_00794560 [Tetrahymena thermophila SB210]|eukprot:XP_001020975.2 hypothetical protein TTHERM_00794560 [Tetrahymena thermophila SB210]
MISQMIDQELINHLQEVDILLLDLNDIHNIRMKEQEEQLNIFIQEGFIRPLSEREGLFLITQNQLNLFHENIRIFNNRLDKTEEQIKILKEKGMKFSLDINKYEYKINNLEKEKQILEKTLQNYQIDKSSKIEEEEFDGLFEKQIQQIKNNFQNTKIQELQNQVFILKNQLEERNNFFSQFEQTIFNQSQQDQQMSVESQQNENVDSKEDSNQNLIQTLQQKVQLLYSQVNFYKKLADENHSKMKQQIESRMSAFQKELKKQQFVYEEIDDDVDDSKAIVDIQFSNSRTLQIVELQKQVYLLEEERDRIQRNFDNYQKQTESELKEMQSHKIEVQEYKQKLEEALKILKAKTNDNLTKQQMHFEDFKQYQLKIELLNQQNQNLNIKLEEEQSKVYKIKSSYEQSRQQLEQELQLKNEIIRRFDPQSDVYKDLQEQISEQAMKAEQFKQDYQKSQKEKHQIQSQLQEQIDKLSEENKILLSLCESAQSQSSISNTLQITNEPQVENKEQVQQSIANNLFKQLYDFQKKKFQSLNLELQIIQAENQQNKQEKIKLLEENSKINQRLRQLQLIQKQNKKNGNTISSSKKGPKSTLKDYEPLSENIQNILTINKEYKQKIQEQQLQIVSLRTQIETLKQSQDLEKSQQSSFSSEEEVMLREDQLEINDDILIMQALQKTDQFKELFQQN